jgi:hypothetical protein
VETETRAQEIGRFLCQEGFSPEQRTLGIVLLLCGNVVESAIEIERAAGEGREKEAIERLLDLFELAYRLLAAAKSQNTRNSRRESYD